MTAQARLLGGRYQVGELLGFGGMAEVHRGRDLRLGRDVAIKTLRHDLARDATFQLRFRREAQNAASLNHPAVVAVYDTGEEHAPTGEELPYIVMEFVNGRTLKEVLTGEGRLMPRRAIEITADICSALDFSHRHGIIHRDIKPGNVMLTQTGQVKVMDFGIARALASGASTMTQTSAVIGTAQYLSPEQARGEAVDARSDVYATGCVLFELITGQPPFVGDNPVSVAYQHVREDPRAPSDVNPDVSPDVDAIVLKALAKNPANRYQSAGEMRADLLRAASGRPVLAPPVMTEDERTAMMTAPPMRPLGHPTRQVARVADRRRQNNGTTAIVVMLTILGMLAVGALIAGIYLARGKPEVSVPDLAGQTSEDAQRLITESKLKADPETNECGDPARYNKVIGQNPQANSKVEEGSTVKFTVCVKAGDVIVPDLLNKTKAEADKALKDLKLVPVFVQIDHEAPVDTVVSVDPPGGRSVPPGTKVTVNLSRGNLKVVPDVSGRTEADARAALASAGFTNVRAQQQNTTDSSQVGRVLSQSPGPNGKAKADAQITIVIGRQQSTPSNPPSSPAPSGSGT